MKEISKEYDIKINDILSHFGSFTPTYESYDHYYIFEFDDDWVVFIYLQTFYERSEILYFWVDPKYRNQYYGTKALNDLILLLKKQGIEEISLEVNVNNVNAIKLYQHNSFTIVRTIKNYYKDQDAYLMFRRL